VLLLDAFCLRAFHLHDEVRRGAYQLGAPAAQHQECFEADRVCRYEVGEVKPHGLRGVVAEPCQFGRLFTSETSLQPDDAMALVIVDLGSELHGITDEQEPDRQPPPWQSPCQGIYMQ
jgi:hypothetical protein